MKTIITYKDGRTKEYEGVAPSIFDGEVTLLNASSDNPDDIDDPSGESTPLDEMQRIEFIND